MAAIAELLAQLEHAYFSKGGELAICLGDEPAYASLLSGYSKVVQIQDIKHVSGESPGEVVAEFGYLPFAPGSVSCVILPFILSHHPAPEEVLLHLKPLMADDGVIITIDYNPWRICARLAWLKATRGERGYMMCPPMFLKSHLFSGGYHVRDLRYLSRKRPGRVMSALMRWGVPLGRYYCLVMQKRTLPLDPAALRARKLKPVIVQG